MNIATLRDSDTVYLLDASIYIFRAWFGYPDHYHDAAGRPVNAVYGYLRTLLSLLDRQQPEFMLAAFDEGLFRGFRHQLYPAYKANRALPDQNLAWQLFLCRRLTEKLGICCRGDAIYEADDWLALGAGVAREQGFPLAVITRDKDLAPLVTDRDLLWDYGADRQMDRAALEQHWQVPVAAIPDLLALMGDSADNIPGIAGVGRQSAVQLIQHYGSLESLYGNLEQVAQLPVRGATRLARLLEGSMEQALLFRELIRLRPPRQPLTLTQLQTRAWDPEYLQALLKALELGQPFLSLVKR